MEKKALLLRLENEINLACRHKNAMMTAKHTFIRFNTVKYYKRNISDAKHYTVYLFLGW